MLGHAHFYMMGAKQLVAAPESQWCRVIGSRLSDDLEAEPCALVVQVAFVLISTNAALCEIRLQKSGTGFASGDRDARPPTTDFKNDQAFLGELQRLLRALSLATDEQGRLWAP
jgi:hypothetical protein